MAELPRVVHQDTIESCAKQILVPAEEIAGFLKLQGVKIIEGSGEKA